VYFSRTWATGLSRPFASLLMSASLTGVRGYVQQ
jgi:hypothetical protein